MANPDRAYGFKPWGPLLAVKHLQKDAAAAAFGINDVVLQTTDGGVDVAGAAGTISNTVGVSLEYSATGTAGRVMLAIDPDQMMQAQDDGAGSDDFVLATLGETGDSTFTTLNTTTKISTMELDTDTFDASGVNQFLLLDILLSDNTDGTTNALDDNGDYIVQWAAHRRGSSTVGV
jgi:hypothetical protein